MRRRNPASPALVEWVDVLSDIAHRENTPKFGRDKYYIGPLADIAAAQGMSRSVFEYKLIQANRAGLLRLSRADLTSAMPRDLVARSEIHYMNADFHFIEFQPYMNPRRMNPEEPRFTLHVHFRGKTERYNVTSVRNGIAEADKFKSRSPWEMDIRNRYTSDGSDHLRNGHAFGRVEATWSPHSTRDGWVVFSEGPIQHTQENPIVLGKFQGPPDAKYAEIHDNGVLIGWIEREVNSEQKGSSRAWTHTVTGYTAHPIREGSNEKTFKTLAEARDYIVRRGNPVPTSALWLGAAALTAFGVYVIVKSVQNQQVAADSGGGYIYEPPITLNT